jgi:hypothetical protein
LQGFPTACKHPYSSWQNSPSVISISSKESKARVRFPNTKYEKEKGGDYDMRAFLVEEKTLNRIISYLDDELRRSDWLRSKFATDLGVNFAGDWKTALGQKMWDLNQLALSYRYGDAKQELWYHFSSVSCPAVL